MSGRPRGRPSPDRRLFTFLARRASEGVVGGWALLLGLLWTDVAGIGSLIDRAAEGWIALLMLVVAFALTGSAVAMGLGIMNMASRD